MEDLVSRPVLPDYQTYVKKICQERSWDKRTSIEKMLFLTEEVGELAKAIPKNTAYTATRNRRISATWPKSSWTYLTTCLI